MLQILGRNPLLNCDDTGIRSLPGTGSASAPICPFTLFLSELDEYEGGELIIQNTYGTQRIRVPAGAMVLNPATILHSVHKGTRGSRWAAFFWSHSMIRNDVQHTLPYQFDCSVIEIRKALPDKRPGKLGLTATCHNLPRQWTEL